MSELLDEDLLPFAKGIGSLPGRRHVSAGYRYISKGCHGVILESILIGGRRYTSRQALRRFVTAVTAAAARRMSPTSTASAEVPLIDDKTEKELDDAGL